MNLAKYIGRSYENYHCFDLVKEFYKDQFNIDLKNYWETSVVPTKQTIANLIESSVGTFEESIGEPKFGDLVIMKFRNIECHIGICIGDGKLIHSLKGCNSSMDRLIRFKHIISRYLRHTEVNKND